MCWARSRLGRSGGGGVGELDDVGEETIEVLGQDSGQGSGRALGEKGALDKDGVVGAR